MAEDPGAAPASGPGLLAIALRFAALIAFVVAATWASHMIRDALEMQIVPSNERQVHRALMAGTAAYVLLLALPFVPGAEIGIALLTLFGAAIAPLVWGATVLAMLLAYAVGRLLPLTLISRTLSVLRLGRAAALTERAAALPRDARLAMILEGAPPRTLAFALRHRYLALGLALNLPGNVVIGGGGGIMLVAGMSGLFAPWPTLLTLMIAVAPVPLTVMILGA